MSRKNDVKKVTNKPTKSLFTKGKWIFLMVVLGVVLFASGVMILNMGKVSDFDVVAFVDDTPVTVREFKQQMLLERGMVSATFRTKYGVLDEPGFWTKKYGNEVPIEVLKQKAFSNEQKIKAQLILAKKEGLIKDISYEAIMADMKEENRVRKEKIEKKQVVYGLAEFSEQNFLSYLISDIAVKLKERLSDKWDISEKELKDQYEALKQTFYVNSKNVKVKEIKLSYLDNDGNINEKIRLQNRDRIGEAQNQIVAGKSFEEVARAFYKGKDSPVHIFNNESIKKDANLYPKLREAAMGLALGGVSTVIEDGSSVYIIKCIDIENNSYTPFENVKDNIKTRLIDTKYDDYIDELVSKAKIKKIQTIYDKIEADSL